MITKLKYSLVGLFLIWFGFHTEYTILAALVFLGGMFSIGLLIQSFQEDRNVNNSNQSDN